MNDGETGIILGNRSGNNILIGDRTNQSTGAVAVQKMADDGDGGLTLVGASANLMIGGLDDAVVVSGYLTLDSDKAFAVDATGTNAVADNRSSLEKVADLDVTTFAKATNALKTVDSALSFINGERAKLGALQSRFEASIGNLQVTSENLSSSRSRILDADFAAETANLSRSQILQQAGTAMVAQANQLPQGVLALLR
ncbi:flagellin [Acidovorax sp. Q11]